MSAASTETNTPLPTAGSRVFFQGAPGVGCVSSSPINGDDPVQKKQGKVTVKYDRKELRKRLVLEEWIIEQLSELITLHDDPSTSSTAVSDKQSIISPRLSVSVGLHEAMWPFFRLMILRYS
ncbi:hypothetical protein GOODEAATRI_004108 [Goodea atripinnis]|uniref:Protein phosphatase 1 regulatory inhibitor subunit 14C n=1 Tax=Goodea atripinnis TaxID=208336 RepID=A0ABV0NA56_9TELE